MVQKQYAVINFLLLITLLLFNISCGESSISKKESIFSDDLYKADTRFNVLTKSETAYYAAAVKKFYDSMLLNTGFNGAILVAKNGQIVFESYQGYINFANRDTITEHSPFHLASISKTFTGMAILRLCEQKKLALTDSVQKFFPSFPYHNITIQMLLSHRSGLPNYLYFMDSLWDKTKKATNQDVINMMIQYKPAPVWVPDTHYNYCNTNFLLLASIIEKISGQTFPDFMKEKLFQPLGMKDTYVFSLKDTGKYIPTISVSKPFLMDAFDCTYGDKNIYSTVRDLFTWDKALYQHVYITKASLALAFTPQSNEQETMHNYGLAWHTFINNGDTLIYHNGKWHGSNTVFSRLVQDTATIIVLGNKLNRNIYRAKQMGAIFTGVIDDETEEE